MLAGPRGPRDAARAPRRVDRGPWRDLRAPLAIAITLRLVLVWIAPTVPSWDGVIYVRAAEQLAHGDGYTLRILAEANQPSPTAFYPVGFPAVLALVRMVGGGLLADRLLQATASALLVPLAYLLARRARNRRAGRWAAWLSAFWPGGVFLSATWLAEPMFALGAGLSLLPLAYARRRQRLYALAIAALGLGLVAYMRATALPIAGLLGLALGWDWLRARSRVQRIGGAIALAGATFVVACLPLAPWALRNQRLLGAPVLVSTNGGVNLLLGARGDGGFTQLSPEERCKNEPLREVARDRCYQARAVELIAADPLAWLGRGLIKLAHTYGHDSAPAQCFGDGLRTTPGTQETWRLWALGLCRLSWLFLLSAMIGGGRFALTRTTPTLRAILFAPVLAIAALHTAYLGGDRYHAAVAPMLFALAGIALGGRSSRAGLSRSDTLPPDRLDAEPRTQA